MVHRGNAVPVAVIDFDETDGIYVLSREYGSIYYNIVQYSPECRHLPAVFIFITLSFSEELNYRSTETPEKRNLNTVKIKQ